MNLVIMCGGCGSIFRVMQQKVGADVDSLVGEHSEFWPDKYLCPRCDAHCAGMNEEQLPRGMQTKDIVDLTPEEMLSAQHGLGLPGDEPSSFDAVCEMLLEVPIKFVFGHDVEGTKRCVLDCLKLEDGTAIHLGASAHGAVVFRVVKPISYAERVEKQR